MACAKSFPLVEASKIIIHTYLFPTPTQLQAYCGCSRKEWSGRNRPNSDQDWERGGALPSKGFKATVNMSDRITNNAKLCKQWPQLLAISFHSGFWELLARTSVDSQCPRKSKLWETGHFGVSLGLQVLFRNPRKLGLTWGTIIVSNPSSVHPTEFYLYLL